MISFLSFSAINCSQGTVRTWC